MKCLHVSYNVCEPTQRLTKAAKDQKDQTAAQKAITHINSLEYMDRVADRAFENNFKSIYKYAVITNI